MLGQGNGQAGRALQLQALLAGAGVGGVGAAGAMAAFIMPNNQPPPPPLLAEPPGLSDGGLINIPCTALKIDSSSSIVNVEGRGQGGAQRNDYEKYVIHQPPEPYSMCAPSEDILVWANRSGREITVVNTRLQMMTTHHRHRTDPLDEFGLLAGWNREISKLGNGIVLSNKCVMFTNESGFVLVISLIDKSFRLTSDTEIGITINGRPLGGNPLMRAHYRVIAGRSTHVLKDKDTIVHLMAEPALALFFRIRDIKQCVENNQRTIEPFKMIALSNLPSTATGRNDPLESVIMMLENRIILGAPILQSDRLDWAWLDTDTFVVRNEEVLSGPDGSPLLHPSYLLKIRVNPLNLDEIYVHIVLPRQNRQDDQQSRGELWVMGMSTKENTFQWKRRERPPSLDDPDYKQIMQTPIDWTRTPEGILYVRWCDFDSIGPSEEYLCDYRHCRSFTLTRVENTVSTLSSIAARVLQGFDRLPFPLPRTEQQQQPMRRPILTLSDRRRAAVSGVTTAPDFMRHVAAIIYDNTSHVYYEAEQLYDDSEDLIERQRKNILKLPNTTYRSIFGTLFSEARKIDHPTGKRPRLRPPPIKKDDEKMDTDDQPGPSNRLKRHRRGDESVDEENLEEIRRERGVQFVEAARRWEGVQGGRDHPSVVARAVAVRAADAEHVQRAADAAAAMLQQHEEEQQPGMM